MYTDELIFPPLPIIGVSGIVFNCHEVLLIRRNQPPALGLWSIPGGKMKPGESMTEACRREVKEETGLDIRIVSLVAVVERRIENFHYVILDFLAQLIDRNQFPVAGSDVSEARWVNVERLSEYELVLGLVEIILRSYRRQLGNDSPGLIDATGQATDFIWPHGI